YVVPYSGAGGKWQISSTGIAFGFNMLSNFAWLSNNELMYASGERRYAVTLAPRGEALEIGVPRAILGETPVAGPSVIGGGTEYSPSRRRSLAAPPIHGERPTPVFLVTNWAAGLLDR